MTRITHAFTNPKSDGGDATVTRPSDWNADHVLVDGATSIGAKAYNSTTQSVTGSTATALTLDSEEFDTDGFHSTASTTERMTIPAGMGGKYLLRGGSMHNGSIGSDSLIRFKKNGTTYVRGTNVYYPQGDSGVITSAIVDAAAGDYFVLEAYTNAGTRNYGNASSLEFQTTFEIVKLDSGRVGSGVGAKAYNSTTQAVNSTSAALTLDSEEFDTDGFHSTSSATSRMTIPAGLAGKYLIQGGSFGSAAWTWVGFKKNGSTVRGFNSVPGVSAYGSAAAVLDLVAGDYVELWVNTSATCNMGHASLLDAQSWLSVMRLDSSGFSVARIVRGVVNADGSTARGTGFTSAKTATGRYTVTFTAAFSTAPVVSLTPASTGATGEAISLNGDPSTTAFSVYTTDPTGATFTDYQFHFVAMSVD